MTESDIAFKNLFSGLQYGQQLEEQQERHRKEFEQLLHANLEVMDALEALASNAFPSVTGKESGGDPARPPVGSPARSIEIIRRLLLRALSEVGVRPMETIGLPFDLEQHCIVAEQEDTSREPGTVLYEDGKGYLWRGRVLRPAKVVVADSGCSAENSACSIPVETSEEDIKDLAGGSDESNWN